MTIAQWLATATVSLQAVNIATARLDALVLLSDELRQNQAWLLAHPEYELTPSQLQQVNTLLAERQTRKPLAYIRGVQEFYRRSFIVNPNVLIPRPESEAIITELAQLPQQPGSMLLDIGTGSGCLGVTAALEHPNWHVTLLDTSQDALAVARQNAQRLNATVRLLQSDLLAAWPVDQKVDYIIANLPYVSTDWPRSPETNFEPPLALFADNNGLDLIANLLPQAAHVLCNKGYLLLEADPRQHQAIVTAAKQHNLRLLHRNHFVLVLQKS